MVVNIIDHAFAHCIYSNNPLPPIQMSKYIEWNRQGFEDNSTIIATDNDTNSSLFLSHNGKKIAWLLECIKINNYAYEYILNNHNLYDFIFTHDKEYLQLIPNSKWVPFGGCWIYDTNWNLYEKENKISIVVSSKNYLTGHRLRHQVISNFANIDVYGNGYNPIDNKISSLIQYKYQIVIENEKIAGYFTEKLIDCFVTGTIPIYWGDPLISEVFDIDGIIQFNTIEELRLILDNIDEIKIDKKNIENNFNKAKDYILAEDYIYKNYKELL